jgi:hypothetical protein
LLLRELLDNMSAQFFYLQFVFTPKIGHTFTDEREVVVEVPKRLVQRRSDLINESLKEVLVGPAKSAAQILHTQEPLPSIARFGGVRALFTFPSVHVRKCCPASEIVRLPPNFDARFGSTASL